MAGMSYLYDVARRVNDQIENGSSEESAVQHIAQESGIDRDKVQWAYISRYQQE